MAPTFDHTGATVKAEPGGVRRSVPSTATECRTTLGQRHLPMAQWDNRPDAAGPGATICRTTATTAGTTATSPTHQLVVT